MKFKKVLIDLSGTLHVENAPINGAPGALNRLRMAGLSVKFVTNTSKESCQQIYERLIGLGFDLEKSEILSAVTATKQLVLSQQLNPLLMVEQAVLEDFKDVQRGACYDSVVVGLSPSDFNYDTLTEAFKVLLGGGELIAMNKSRYFKTKSGLSLGTGCFVHGLEYSCDCVAHVVGKPSEHFFRAAVGDTMPEETIMIGDDVRDDVEGAQVLGIRGILVKTGKYREGDFSRIDPPPFAVAQDFPGAVEMILSWLESEE